MEHVSFKAVPLGESIMDKKQDKYACFADLAGGEVEGIDYRICMTVRASPIAILAPHGGEIELGTSQIATAIAANKFSLYCFEGLIPRRPHSDLHITSDRFDEPTGCQLVETSEISIGVHGRKDADDNHTIWLGGRNVELRAEIAEALTQGGFNVMIRTPGQSLSGIAPTNICNRGRRKAGVQLEVPWTVRATLVGDSSQRMAFAAAVRGAIDHHIAQDSG
jgi:phage replication-related protein YjqB (UPF0714/DUF867 family)